jgi:DNA (cytosine-5)-methyltransferase 1
MKLEKRPKSKPKVIDMFCGCGGLSLGFLKAGYDVVLGIDREQIALETFRKNHRDSKAMNIDLFDDNFINEIEKNIDCREIDVIIGGPPCQGFSLTGPRDENDERNKLYLSVYKAVKHFEPQAFLIENVPGMATMYKGKTKNHIIHLFIELGYNVTFKILTASDYGVPQMRKRAFFVGVKDGNFEFPEPKLSPENYITCGEAISDLPSLEDTLGDDMMEYESKPLSEYQKMMREGSTHLFNHVGTRHTDHVINVISQVPEGGNHKDLPIGVGDSRRFNEAWTRYHSQKPSKTIDTGHRNHFHYKWNRVPTIRENARLQSFPDDFVFLGTKTQQNRQVGNAVPPLLSYAIAEKIMEYITVGDQIENEAV